MHRICLLILISFIALSSEAQIKVRFTVTEKTTIQHDSIYITGTFRNWDSVPDPKYRLQKTGDRKFSLVLDLPKGDIRFKVNRGTWQTVEKQYNANEVNDHLASIQKDTSIDVTVNAWRDGIINDKMAAMQSAIEDSTRINIMVSLSTIYAFYPEFFNADSAMMYAEKALQLQQSIISKENKTIEARESSFNIWMSQEVLATLFRSMGNYTKSLELHLVNLSLTEKLKEKIYSVQSISNLIPDYLAMKDFQNVLRYCRLADSLLLQVDNSLKNNKREQWWITNYTGIAYFNMDSLDKSLLCGRKLQGLSTYLGDQFFNSHCSKLLADIYLAKGNKDSAFYYYRNVFSFNTYTYARQLAVSSYAGLAKLFKQEGRIDSALFYARQALMVSQTNKENIMSWGENSDTYTAEISPLLAEIYYANHQPDSAYKYLKLSVTLRDSLNTTERVRQFQILTSNEANRKDQLIRENRRIEREYKNKLMIGIFIGGLIVLLGLAIFLYRNNKQKQKANALLNNQKNSLENTLAELKLTQKQLIQSEKMASLGELTAGIAHEIQNPLNFVNNFSEVNMELIEELKSQKSKVKNGESEDVENELLHDIAQNLEKINHHGKRADAIVKGMLQHSRSGGGQKEPTDINALVDEYLRLSYHGLRAKNKSFNAILKTDFDANIGKQSIVSQDIGRVVLNLLTNAFYVVNDKKKSTPTGYEPTVTVITRKTEGKIVISVIDNGNGIPEKVKEKIFQPFFTTKPTGQGTGLGLSLSYDIIKSHGGNLIATNITDNENPELVTGARFTIEIPIN